jgi:hypothetical protein
MAKRRCLDCSTLITTGSRCRICRNTRDRAKGIATGHPYAGTWRTTSQQLRAAHVERYGWHCPGWDTPPHPSHDLCVDHGTGTGNLVVLCRACNGRKAATFDKQAHTGGPGRDGLR